MLGAWWGGWGTTGGVHKLNHCSVQQLGAAANAAARLIITHIISRRGGDIRPTAVDVCDHKARCIGARHRHHLHRTCGRFDGGGVPMCYSVRVRARARVRVRAMLSSKQKDVGEGVPPLWETAPFTQAPFIRQASLSPPGQLAPRLADPRSTLGAAAPRRCGRGVPMGKT